MSMKLLLIDAESTPQSNWLRRRLELENNQVSVSPDWQTGCSLLYQAHFDVVLLTICLAGSEGLALPDRWLLTPCDVPLLLIVSPDTTGNKVWGLESGADDCVGHSVDSRELHARIQALCRRKTGHVTTSSVLRIADLELNQSSRTAYRGDRRIDLLPRECSLLAFLLENKGRVVSKKEILANVWRISDPVKSNKIEVYINYLRFKIDRQSTVKLIHTVPGMGYIIRTTEHD